MATSYIHAHAQLAIIGPACVNTTIDYQYIINRVPNASNMQICITGGKLAGSDSSCYNGNLIRFFKVRWTSLSPGSINVTINGATTSMTTMIYDTLKGGTIDSSNLIQIVKVGIIPVAIHCSQSTGGHCSAEYSYQWQQSTDGLTWTNVEGATSKDMSFTSGLTATRYYRRKTSEVTGNSIVYSNISLVSVIP